MKNTSYKYGKLFKEIRKQKQLPLTYFEPLGIGKSHLAKFERGDLVMSFDRVNDMLHAMNVSLGEFELIANYFNQDFQTTFILELEKAEYFLDKEYLLKLYDEATYETNFWLLLLVKARIQPLSQHELLKIKEHLSEITQWGYFELSLLFSCIEFFDIYTMVSFLEQLKIKNRVIYGEIRYRRKLFQIIYRVVGFCVFYREEELAREIMKQSQPVETGNIDFYISNLKRLHESMIIYTFEDKLKGKEKLENALNIMDELGNVLFRKYHQMRVLNFLHLDYL